MSSVIKIDTTVEKNGLTLEKVCQLFCSKKVFQIQNSAFTWYQINFWISNLILLPLTKSFFSYCRIFSFKLPKNVKARAYRKRNNKKGNIVFCNLFTRGALKSSFKKKNSFERVRASQIELEFESIGFKRDGKTGVPGERPLGARKRTNNTLNAHMA